MVDFYKEQDQKHRERDKCHARLQLLDEILFDLYNNDPFIHARLQAYINGQQTLEQCLILIIHSLSENRKDLLNRIALIPISPVLKIGEVK